MNTSKPYPRKPWTHFTDLNQTPPFYQRPSTPQIDKVTTTRHPPYQEFPSYVKYLGDSTETPFLRQTTITSTWGLTPTHYSCSAPSHSPYNSTTMKSEIIADIKPSTTHHNLRDSAKRRSKDCYQPYLPPLPRANQKWTRKCLLVRRHLSTKNMLLKDPKVTPRWRKEDQEW